MFRIVIPIAVIVLAGCGRQDNPAQAANPTAPAQAVNRPVEGGGAPQPTPNAATPVYPTASTVASSPPGPVARPNPVVFAEPADPPSPRREKPSAFEPRERAATSRVVRKT